MTYFNDVCWSTQGPVEAEVTGSEQTPSESLFTSDDGQVKVYFGSGFLSFRRDFSLLVFVGFLFTRFAFLSRYLLDFPFPRFERSRKKKKKNRNALPRINKVEEQPKVSPFSKSSFERLAVT